jgi:hypothetical protein
MLNINFTMSNKFLAIAFFVSALMTTSIFGQNAEGTKVNTRDNPGKKYMRPSLTMMYVNRGTDRSERMMNIFNANPVPGKFNDHKVNIRSISVKNDTRNVRSVIEPILRGDISRQIVAKWFNRDANGGFSMDLISERGLYNASDADVIKAKASQRKMELLKDAGENLLDRSYIVVYDVRAIYTTDEYASKKGYSTDKEGYIAYYDCYLYKLDWTDSVAAIFYNDMWMDASNLNPDKANLFNKTNFPLVYVATVTNEFGYIESSQYKDHSKNFFGSSSDDQLFANLYTQIMNETDVSLAKVNEDFKVKVPVYSTKPIRAKIGLKEGLSVDRRFFVYEFELGEDGKQITKRKAVVRASSNIIDNRRMSDGNSETSRFYQVAGRKVYEGMLLQENPDWGLGLTIGYGANPENLGEGLTATFEASVSQWGGKAISGLPSGIKVYATGALGLVDYELDNGTTSKPKYSTMSYAVGLSKDLYFFRSFVLVPFAGYGNEELNNTISGNEKDKYKSEFIQFGVRLGINVTYNIQLIGTVYSGAVLSVKLDKDNDIGSTTVADLIKKNREIVQFGGGIRYLF